MQKLEIINYIKHYIFISFAFKNHITFREPFTNTKKILLPQNLIQTKEIYKIRKKNFALKPIQIPQTLTSSKKFFIFLQNLAAALITKIIETIK